MFIRTLTLPEWPSDFAVSNHSLEITALKKIIMITIGII